jgi:hypothetical protein
VTGIPGFGKETQIRQFQIPDFPGHLMDQRPILLSLKIGMGQQEDQKHPVDSAQNQAEGRFSHRKPTLAGLLLEKRVNQES